MALWWSVLREGKRAKMKGGGMRCVEQRPRPKSAQQTSHAYCPHLPAVLSQLHHQTLVLHHGDPLARQTLSDRIVEDAELQPDALRPFDENVVEMSGEILRTAKYVDHVDV